VKLDENVPDSVATTLRDAGHDVALARDEQLVGADDERVLSVATAEGRVLITLDLDFTDIRRHPPQATPGIVVFRLHAQTITAMRLAATACGALMQREPIAGRLWILDESRLRIWPAG
jgi:predicted nuclease of predicted toxin-antitoxin system